LAKHAAAFLNNFADRESLAADRESNSTYKNTPEVGAEYLSHGGNVTCAPAAAAANYDLWSKFPPVELVALSAPFERRFLRLQQPKRTDPINKIWPLHS
jgi:hypothetical protein